jgi:hypothetical protein
MNEERRDKTQHAASAEAISPAAYNAFIQQIELRAIWLRSADVKNAYGPGAPKEAAIAIGKDASYEQIAAGFRTIQQYTLRIEGADTLAAEIKVEFAADFASHEPMTDGIFTLFKEVNLPVNTWPYLREFVANTLGRWGWEPFTLPAFKSNPRPTPRPVQTR